MVSESRLESTEHGLVPKGDCWFVLNALAGEAVLIVEGEERPLREWDFVHCPAGTKHIIVGGGHAPSLVLAVGARDHSGRPDWGGYVVDGAALRHGARVEQETTDPREAYARFTRREPTGYREGCLPE